MKTLIRTLFGEGEDAAAAYFSSLDLPAVPKQNAGPLQATGRPDAELGESTKAWASGTPNDAVEWLQLRYAQRVRARAVHVYQTQNPGAVTQVGVYAENGEQTSIVVSNAGESISAKGLFVTEIPLRQHVLTDRVRLTVDAPSVLGWNQIDAVALEDEAGVLHWAVDASASSSEYETHAPGIFDDPSEWGLVKLGETFARYDRYAEAVEVLSLALRLYPGSEEARRQLISARASLDLIR